ncbi:hypothetical protein PC123_g561 [Phytophthora cactorum]|nr:hypothetical protein PC123_g561 [Phytophthora cactorum]
MVSIDTKRQGKRRIVSLRGIPLRNVAPLSANFHRATRDRVEQARLQRMAHEAANPVFLGRSQLAIWHSECPTPDNSVFEATADDTTAQAIELNQQRAALKANAAAQDQQRSR